MTSGACHAKVVTVPGAGLHHVEEVLWTAFVLRTQTKERPKEREPILARTWRKGSCSFAKAAALEHCF